MAKTIHSMIRVLDEARSVDFYSQAFGLSVADRLDFESFTLVYLSNAESSFELELTINKGRTEPYALGDGYGHLAVSVEDVDAAHARLDQLGFAPRRIVDFRNSQTLVARFFFVADPDGYQIEVIQRGGQGFSGKRSTGLGRSPARPNECKHLFGSVGLEGGLWEYATTPLRLQHPPFDGLSVQGADIF